MTIGLVSAMPEELRALLPCCEVRGQSTVAGRAFHTGVMAGHDVVLVLSGIGKVAAAATASVLLDRFAVDALIFTGVAGGLGNGVRVGDVVIARELLQHDLDVSPLFPRYEVPAAGRARFACSDTLSSGLAGSARALGLTVHEGLVISGDQFISSVSMSADLQARLPDALAVDMEGAAVAQVCADFGKPFAMLRTVSDRADDQAHVDFSRFVSDVAADVSHRVILKTLLAMVAAPG